MSRKPKADDAPERTPEELAQDQATKPRPVDDQGRELDEWGLPLSGPARARALAGRPDPALDEAMRAEAAAADGNVGDTPGEGN